MINFTKPHLSGKNNGRWKGGRSVRKDGYVEVYAPWHRSCNKRGTILEHRLIMGNILGRTLLRDEVVHHINGNVSDNREENLELIKSQKYHASNHMKIIARYRKRDVFGKFL